MINDRGGEIKYVPHVDGLRALAVIIVILFHLDPKILPGGYLGVDIFFVISGFVITQSLFKEYINSGTINIVNFYIRRLKRLYPALLLMVLVTTVFYIFFGFLWDTNVYLKSAGSAILATSNLYFIFQQANYFSQDLVNPLTHTWSLGIEEQFYFVYPAVLFLGLYLIRKFNLKVSTLASAVLGTSIILFAYFIFNQENVFGNFFSPIARFWELGFGCFLFLISREFEIKKHQNTLMWIALILISFVQVFKNQIDNLFIETSLTVIGTFSLIYAGISGEGIVKELFKNKIPVYIGKISYSLYLWHFPVIYFANLYFKGVYFWMFSIVLSFVIASLSYHFFEQPIRYSSWPNEYLRKIIKKTPQILVVLLALVLLIGPYNITQAINNTFNSFGEKIKKVNYIERSFNLGKRIQPDFTVNGNYIETCSDYDLTFELNDEGLRSECFKRTDNSPLFYLTGDSHALHFASTFDNSEIVKNLYFVEIPRQSIVKENPKDFNEEFSLMVLKEQEDELKRLKNEYSEIYYVTSFFFSPWQDQEEVIRKNLKRYIDTLGQYSNLVFIAPTPVFPTGPESCVLLDKHCEISRSEDLDRRKVVFEILKDFESEYNNVYVYDPYFDICPKESCITYDKKTDTLYYMDKDHLSPEYSKSLAPSLDSWLEETFGF